MKMDKREWTNSSIVLMMIGMLQFIYIVYLELKNYLSILNSDVATDLMLAEELAHSGDILISSNFVYTTELHVLYTQIIQSLLFCFTSSYKKVFILSFIIHTILISICMLVLVKYISKSISAGITAVILLLIPSGEFYMWIFQQQSYLAYLLYSLLFFVLYFTLSAEGNNRKTITLASGLLWILLSFFMGLSGMRYFPVTVIPIVIYEFIMFLYNNNTRERMVLTRGNKIAVFSALSSAMGFIIYRCILLKQYGPFGTTNGTLTGTGDVLDNILYTPVSIFEMWGGWQFVDKQIVSVYGAFQIIEICSICMMYALFFRRTKDDRKLEQLQKLAWISIVVTWYLLTFTSLGKSWNRKLELHYFILGFILFIPYVAIQWNRAIHTKYMGSCRVMIAALAFSYILVNDIGAWKGIGIEYNTYPDYIDAINEMGYEFGWTTDFWLANRTTALSNGRIRIGAFHKAEDETAEINMWGTRRDYENLRPEFILVHEGEDIAWMEKALDCNAQIVYQAGGVILYEPQN